MKRIDRSALRSLRSLAERLFADDEGQDLIEYALLTAVIASGTAALMPFLMAAVSGAYTTWSAARNGLYIPPDPAP